jgi:hypothetical protein
MKDPIAYAQSRVIEEMDNINNVKKLIIEYFSNLQSDETPVGAMRRLQIRKDLLDFAHK